MTLPIKMTRPLAVFDIESTGVNRKADRIIDLAILVITPDGSRITYEFRINPGIPIPPESTAIHGIRDEDVKGCKSFKEQLPQIKQAFAGCDLAGYNILAFDIPLLEEEFLRVNDRFDMTGRRVLDAQKIFHKREPRDLSAALRFYAGGEHESAHSALGDVEATTKVIEGQFRKYGDLPLDMDALDAYCNPKDPTWLDREGRLRLRNGEPVISFGKNQGRTLKELVKNEPRFLEWILRSDFPKEMQTIVRAALQGETLEKFFPKADTPE
ncbi:MAG: 3'-5' exonuclease [Kiritimatiellia bacterium]